MTIDFRRKINLNRTFIKYIKVLIPGIILTFLIVPLCLFAIAGAFSVIDTKDSVDYFVFCIFFIVTGVIPVSLWVGYYLWVIFSKKLNASIILKIFYIPLIFCIGLTLLVVWELI